MRDTTIHTMMTNLVKYIQQVEQSARLGITGEAVRAEALTQLLISKGIFTQEEMTTSIGEVIKKANEPKQPEVAPSAPEIVPATPEQVTEIQKTVEETK